MRIKINRTNKTSQSSTKAFMNCTMQRLYQSLASVYFSFIYWWWSYHQGINQATSIPDDDTALCVLTLPYLALSGWVGLTTLSVLSVGVC